MRCARISRLNYRGEGYGLAAAAVEERERQRECFGWNMRKRDGERAGGREMGKEREEERVGGKSVGINKAKRKRTRHGGGQGR